MSNEKVRLIDVNGFMINAAIDEANKIRAKIEELESLKNSKLAESETKRIELNTLEEDIISISENIATLKVNKGNLMDKVESLKK